MSVKAQQVLELDMKDLVLWTENPRDPIDPKASDQDVVDRALENMHSKWNLDKLAAEMGDYYDLSELPTVVYHGKYPVVYDGNRRIVLGKIKLGLVTVPKGAELVIPEFPEKIPCNVCERKIGLNNVFRKHSESGSWQPLERDLFLHRFMGKEKSSFLVLEEDTGLISANPHLNQRFVKDEIFRDDVLNTLGFNVKDGRLYTVHSKPESRAILSDLSAKVGNKEITTRKNRGKVLDILDVASQQFIEQNKAKAAHLAQVKFTGPKKSEKTPRQARRTARKETELFGGALYLRMGEVSDLYRDIVDLFQFYTTQKEGLSATFPSLIRMALRLLCETAAKDSTSKKLDKYIQTNYPEAKKELDKDIKTTLANQNVSEDSIIRLLHTGAHNYQTASNIDQTIALSIILGAMLTLSHGRKD